MLPLISILFPIEWYQAHEHDLGVLRDEEVLHHHSSRRGFGAVCGAALGAGFAVGCGAGLGTGFAVSFGAGLGAGFAVGCGDGCCLGSVGWGRLLVTSFDTLSGRTPKAESPQRIS